jgi:branched-chain amino acid transport system substrate-binding protein
MGLYPLGGHFALDQSVARVVPQGGVTDRKIKLRVEDSTYDPRNAVLAAQKLVNQEKIFAMVGHLGTAQNMAAMPVQFQKNVINFFPVGVPKLAKEKGAKKVCAMYQDDEFGLDHVLLKLHRHGSHVLRGAEDGLKANGMAMGETTSFKRGATQRLGSDATRMSQIQDGKWKVISDYISTK